MAQRLIMRILVSVSLCLLCISPIFAQEDGDLIQQIATEEQLGIFAAALQQTEWGSRLADAGPYTIFAPTDQAFAAAFERLGTTQEEFFSDGERLRSLLSYHILAEAQNLAELSARSSVMPLRRSSLVLSLQEGDLLLNEEARVVRGDITASNGWLHIVDSVLLAPGEFAIADADNASYLYFGLAAVTVIMLFYLASVFWRWQMVKRETNLIRLRMEERGRDS